ncbi:MAG: hypothetical protein HUU35_02490 [Armatimonadetes bacterium]|nr:hypothetical protein [Armatimonadota bacterium]
MRRLLRPAVGLALTWLVGCGGGGGNGGGSGGDPSGRPIAGTGAVTSSAEARQRVLQQYLGLAGARQTTPGTPFIGDFDDPFVDVYEVPGTPHNAGTTVQAGLPSAAATTLNEPYYLFWVDPRPEALLGHPCFVLYVKASDGTLIEQPALFDPTVNGTLPLYGRRPEHRLYEHTAAEALRVAIHELPGPVRSSRQVEGATVKGLSIGAGDSGGANDFFNTMVEDLYTKISGDETSLTAVALDPPLVNDLPATELDRLLRDASAGLGAGDKFVLAIMGHGSTEGIRLGQTHYTWEQLVRAIERNVAAGHINLIVNACYAGAIVPALQAFDDRSAKALRFVGTTDENHVAVDSFALELIKEQLASKIDQAREVSPGLSLDELEDAFASVFVTSADVEIFIDEQLDELEQNAGTPEAKEKARAARQKILENPSGDASAFGFPSTSPLPQ